MNPAMRQAEHPSLDPWTFFKRHPKAYWCAMGCVALTDMVAFVRVLVAPTVKGRLLGGMTVLALSLELVGMVIWRPKPLRLEKDWPRPNVFQPIASRR